MIEHDEGEQVLALSEERLQVGKRLVETDRVRVRTVVDAREMMVEGTVETGELEVQRRPVDQQVDAAPPPRQEGDTTVISLVEERLVVEKRLFVTEEVHIRRVSVAEQVSVPVTVRTMRAEVERDGDGSTGGI